MPAIARGQTSNSANPVLDLFSSVNGVAVDLFSLSFQVFDDSGVAPVQVYPVVPGDKQAVDVGGAGRLALGHYVADWTVPAAEAVGVHRIKWFSKLTAGATERTFEESFDVLDENSLALGVGDGNYCLVADLRDEGVPATVTDRWIFGRIQLASKFIERATGRFFYPKSMAINVDGTGRHTVLLEEPIISISKVQFESSPFRPSSLDIEADLLRVYNRHLSQNLTNPDDRDNPKIELFQASYDILTSTPYSFTRLIFPSGNQNIHIEGVFGYTDPDGSSTGAQPVLIRHVCKLLVMRELAQMNARADRSDAMNAYRLLSERTRDQAYSLDGLGKRVGQWTGDPEIDGVLASFMRPPRLGAA